MSFRRAVVAAAVLALLVGGAAVLLRPSPPAPLVAEPPPPAPPPAEQPVMRKPLYVDAAMGGAYGGVVVDEQDRPVRDADVVLVAVDADAKTTMLAPAELGEEPQVLDLPTFGEYVTAARGRTDASGRFVLSAGGTARVVALVAWERAFSPGLIAHTPSTPLKPGHDHRVRLRRAGWLSGTVVDAATQQPVAGAEVIVYLQHRANQGLPGPEPETATNAYGRFQAYLSKQLGQAVWSRVPLPGDTGLRLVSERDGRFLFGPVMEEAQVEVVVTHPEYMWTEHDPEVFFESDRGKGRRRRTVIPAGETVERNYALQKGREIRGRVVDAKDQPIEGVEVGLDHVAQYAQHPRYRTHSRFARTDSKGAFRIAGLSYPPYNLRMTHPSFDTEHFAGVQEGSNETYKIVAAGGWVEVAVEGVVEAKPFTAQALLDPVSARPGTGRGEMRRETVLVSGGRARVERVRPGRYTLTLVSAHHVSDAASIEVEPGKGATATVEMRRGGSVRIPVRDGAGRPVDPVSVELYEAGPDEGVARRGATFVSREGLAAADGLLPGRYHARLSGHGLVPTTTEPFDVAGDATTTLPPVVLRRASFLRITGLNDAEGRPVAVETALLVGPAGGELERKRTREGGLLPVPTGSVILRAEAVDGRTFEQTLEVPEGAIVPVEIRLSR